MMQVLFLSEVWMVILFAIVWFVLQTSAAIISNIIPDRFYNTNNFLFRVRSWEQDGRFYQKVFRIRRWKHLLPDGAAVVKSGFRKKHLTDCSEKGLERFIVETCRAELTHLLAILPFWVFGFFAPPYVIWLMLLYALFVNLPCIVAQRYNRPKLVKLLRGKRKRTNKRIPLNYEPPSYEE